MVTRQIECDEQTDRELAQLALDYNGDLSTALADLLRSREGIESFLDECEEAQRVSLQRQLDASERDFRDGNTVPWSEVKRRNHL